MVPVTDDEVAKILLMPLVEVPRIVVGCLLLSPHVKGLVLHDKAHLVTEIQKFRCWRVVRSPYGVTAHSLEDFQLPSDGILIHGSAKTAEIVMHAHSIDLQRLVVE